MNKDAKGLTFFILYFIFVMLYPFLCYVLFALGLYKLEYDIWGFIIMAIIILLGFGAEFKIQWLMILIPIIIIRKNSKNPLLLRLLTDIRLNNKILLVGICFDILMTVMLYFLNNYLLDIYTILYLVYLSFTSNYIVIYLYALLQSWRKQT